MKLLIGNRTEIQQPIQMRFNELIAGVRADVAVKLYGDDLDQMSQQAQRIAGILRAIPAQAMSASRRRTAPQLRRKDRSPQRDATACRSKSSETVAAAPGGREAGPCSRATRRFAVVVRLPDAQRDDLETPGAIPVMLPAAEGQVARSIPLRSGPAQLHPGAEPDKPRERQAHGGRSGQCARARLGGSVEEAQAKIGQLQLPAGMYTARGGTFESPQSARLRLADHVVPICFLGDHAPRGMALGAPVPARSCSRRGAHGAGGRRVRAIAARYPVLDHGRGQASSPYPMRRCSTAS